MSDITTAGEGVVMHAAVRPYVTTGVALVGASIIAVTPVTASLTDGHIPTVQVSVPVELTQFVNPITEWVSVISAAVVNVGGLAEQIAADPAPILTQFITNQIAYLGTLGMAGQNLVTGLVSALQALPPALQTALGYFAMGQFTTGLDSLLGYALIDVLLPPIEAFDTAWEGTVETIAANLSSLVNEVPNLLITSGIGFLEPVFSTVLGVGNILDSIFAAVQSRDLATILSDIINAPAVLTGDFLNGNSNPAVEIAGLLSSATSALGAGTISILLSLRDSIAASITPATMLVAKAASAKAAATAPSALPNLKANTTTIQTKQVPKAGPADPTGGGTDANSGLVAKAPLTTTITATTGAAGPTGGDNTDATKATGGHVSSTVSKVHTDKQAK
ncbi:MAG TPA: hypothetical protein VMU34_03705 [Mycobacterium sp.]|nr:hypothetical protein [Mycobacterium sp.]